MEKQAQDRAHEREFIRQLQDRGQRASSPRLSMFRVLKLRGPISRTELIDHLNSHGVNPATAYRNINLFKELGQVIETGQGFNRRLELAELYGKHHHHLICENCGLLVDFEAPLIEQALGMTAEVLGISIHTHQVEISGLCKSCTIQTAEA
jgi:Fe2+ or Zn2+ uptake regulation protein